MARIRTIKPEFWTSEQVVECSPSARLLFIGLWNFCDDGGIHPDSPKRIKMEIFPADPLSVEDVAAMVQELVDAGLLLRYEAEGQSLLRVTGWHHQKIDRPTNRYPLPPLEEGSPSGRRAVVEPAASPHPRSRVESSRVDGNGKELSIDLEERSREPGEEKPMYVDRATWNKLLPTFQAVAEMVRLGRNPLCEADRDTVIRCCIVADQRLPPGELNAIIKRVRAALARDRKGSPIGYFKGAVINACSEAGVDFRLAAKFDIPAPQPAPAVA